MEYIVFSLLFTLVLGILVKNIMDVVKSDEEKGCEEIILPLKGHIDDIEMMLRKKANEILWNDKNQNIICLDCGMDEETKKICKLMSNDYKFIYLKDNKNPLVSLD